MDTRYAVWALAQNAHDHDHRSAGRNRYELRVSDGKRPQRTQRTVSAGDVIPGVDGPTTVPSDGDPFIGLLGPDTIAGQPSARTMTKSPLSGAAVTTMCVFVVPRSCKLALLVQVLDLQSTVAGALLNHGRTSLLLVGGKDVRTRGDFAAVS